MTTSPTSSLSQFINMPALLDRVDNDHEFLRELFKIFKREFPRLCLKLQESVLEKNMQQAVKAAHMLKGMLANLSMERAAAAVGAVEEMAVAEDQPRTTTALAVFDDEVAGLLAVLDAYLDGPQP